MRSVVQLAGLSAALILIGVAAGSACADEEAAKAAALVESALRADKTPALVRSVAAKEPGPSDLAKRLARHADLVAPLTERQLSSIAALAKRDGEAAVPFAEWLTSLAAATFKEAPKSATACRALMMAHLGRARLGVALTQRVPAEPWTRAADLLIKSVALEGKAKTAEDEYVRAIALVHEGLGGKKAAVVSLLDHAGSVCARVLRARPDSEPVRRATVTSYQKQAEMLLDISRQRTQAALGGYFDAFGSIAKGKDNAQADVFAWNKMVTFARDAKLDVKADYIARRGTGAHGLISYYLPDTGRWEGGRGSIEEKFEGENLWRTVDFETFAWNMVYSAKSSHRTVGGDNLKGIATRSYDARIDALKSQNRKIKKKKKPSRKRFNKTLPSGMEYVIEWIGRRGGRYRFRCFFVKAVKAETTIEIIIYESPQLTAFDAEWEDVMDSFDITKKKR